MKNSNDVGDMHRCLVGGVGDLTSARDFVDVKAVIRRLSDVLEMDHFISGSQMPVSYVRPLTTIIDGYPEQWRALYHEADYISIDPTVRHCRNSTLPLWWTDVGRECDVVAEFFRNAAEHGLGEGISVPTQGLGREWAMLSFASCRPIGKEQRETATSICAVYAPFVHEAVSRLVQQRYASEQEPENTLRLTAREAETLLWTAEGKTSHDVSMILGIAERTVVFHLQNAARKLNVSNRTHAVARAISLGLINPLL